MNKAAFYINDKLIEEFNFKPNDIGILETKELPKHSIITNDGSYVESIIWHLIDAGQKEVILNPDAYGTPGELKVIIK